MYMVVLGKGYRLKDEQAKSEQDVVDGLLVFHNSVSFFK
jgi:hypothetical protein